MLFPTSVSLLLGILLLELLHHFPSSSSVRADDPHWYDIPTDDYYFTLMLYGTVPIISQKLNSSDTKWVRLGEVTRAQQNKNGQAMYQAELYLTVYPDDTPEGVEKFCQLYFFGSSPCDITAYADHCRPALNEEV